MFSIVGAIPAPLRPFFPTVLDFGRSRADRYSQIQFVGVMTICFFIPLRMFLAGRICHSFPSISRQ